MALTQNPQPFEPISKGMSDEEEMRRIGLDPSGIGEVIYDLDDGLLGGIVPEREFQEEN
jgi:hypothetical protein